MKSHQNNHSNNNNNSSAQSKNERKKANGQAAMVQRAIEQAQKQTVFVQNIQAYVNYLHRARMAQQQLQQPPQHNMAPLYYVISNPHTLHQGVQNNSATQLPLQYPPMTEAQREAFDAARLAVSQEENAVQDLVHFSMGK